MYIITYIIYPFLSSLVAYKNFFIGRINRHEFYDYLNYENMYFWHLEDIGDYCYVSTIKTKTEDLEFLFYLLK